MSDGDGLYAVFKYSLSDYRNLRLYLSMLYFYLSKVCSEVKWI